MLTEYAKILEKYGFDYRINQPSTETPFEYISISAGNDELNRNREIIVRIRSFPLNIPPDIDNKDPQPENFEQAVQISAIFPFKVSEDSLGEVARLIAYYNRGLDFVGLGLDEPTKTIFFQYTFLQPSMAITNNTFISIIGMVMMYLDTFGKNLERIANGEEMRTVLKETLESNI